MHIFSLGNMLQYPCFSALYLLVVPFYNHLSFLASLPAEIYLLKVNYRNTKKKCEICSELTIETSEQGHWRGSDVFIVNFEHISYFAQTLNM